MARIEEKRLKKIEKERNQIHDVVGATYTTFEKDGELYFQRWKANA